MKKAAVIIVITAIVTLASCGGGVTTITEAQAATSTTSTWGEEMLLAIESFDGKTIIPQQALKGVVWVESKNTTQLGTEGWGILRANSLEDGIALLKLAEKIEYWPGWQYIPCSMAGAAGITQFLPTTLWWLMGIEFDLSDILLAQDGRAGTYALQKELEQLGYQLSVDGLVGTETKEVIRDYLWRFHSYHTTTSSGTSLVRAAKILVIFDKYRSHIRLKKVGPNRIEMVLRRVEKTSSPAGSVRLVDPFIPLHATASTIAYMEYLHEVGRSSRYRGESALDFAVRAYNAGPGNAKKSKRAGQSYRNNVFNSPLQ